MIQLFSGLKKMTRYGPSQDSVPGPEPLASAMTICRLSLPCGASHVRLKDRGRIPGRQGNQGSFRKV
jgi:hypothetical protein